MMPEFRTAEARRAWASYFTRVEELLAKAGGEAADLGAELQAPTRSASSPRRRPAGPSARHPRWAWPAATDGAFELAKEQSTHGCNA